MDRESVRLSPELRASPQSAVFVLGAVAVGVLLIGGRMDDPYALQLQTVGLSLGATAGLTWLLSLWSLNASRWAVVVECGALVLLLHLWGVAPGALALLALPTAIAAALISVPASIGTALSATGALLLLRGRQPAAVTWAEVTIAMVSLWATLGIMVMVYHPLQQIGDWLDQYFERARASLEEARSRKAELEQALESLAHANRQLALANERTGSLRRIAEEARRTKAAFVANVSHEFRTPLNMIIGLVDLMASTPEIYAVSLSPKMREDLDVVHRNCEHLSQMIDDVLDLTRAEAGQVALHKEWVDIGQIIEDSVSVVRPLLDKKHLTLQVETPDDLPGVYCDRTRVQQVILNLVSNAARYTDEGGVSVAAIRQDGQVLVTVSDTGPGIAAEDARRVFEPFVQAAGAGWQGKGGSGLGLSISKQFVRLHGGRMWLESELGAGTTFHFTLPVSTPVQTARRPAHRIREDWVWREPAFKAARAGTDEQMLRPRVIVCDENGTLTSEYRGRGEAVEFVPTSCVPDALRELERCPAHAVLINASDPESTWANVGVVSRRAPGTPVIGCSVPRLAERAITAGAHGHLVKPVTRDDLAAALEEVGHAVKRVLIIDDDPDVLGLFERMLLVCDPAVEVLVADSGREGLELVRRAQPDLVLLDIVMPEVDGWDVLESIVRESGGQGLPVYFVSAQDPADEPLSSQFMLVSMGGGINLTKLLQCSLQTSARLLASDSGPDQGPGRTPVL
jgi:signal transduction histidine kinase/CheY-like chemotaxis protein